jgi:hypothetical protein
MYFTDSWNSSKNKFTGEQVKSKRKYEIYNNVTISLSNNIDSIKFIKSSHMLRWKKHNIWECDSCSIITFNKYGERYQKSFSNLAIHNLKIAPSNKH